MEPGIVEAPSRGSHRPAPNAAHAGLICGDEDPAGAHLDVADRGDAELTIVAPTMHVTTVTSSNSTEHADKESVVHGKISPVHDPESTPADTESPEQTTLSTAGRNEMPIVLTEAGTGKGVPKTIELHESSSGGVVYPCIAWTPDGAEPPRLLTRAGMGKEKPLSEGTHAFVKMPHESFLRVSIMASDFGESSGHPHLSLEQPVEFAGEIELNAEGRLVRWNNLSGTYQIPRSQAFQVLADLSLSTHSGTPSSAQFVLHAPLLPPQAGLPLDVFWAVHDRNEALPSESFVVRTANATLVKATCLI